MVSQLFKSKYFIFGSVIFLALTAWWVYLGQNDLVGETDQAELFSASYGMMALYGGILGLFVSQKWGGLKSLIGKSVFFISLGLLAQEFGQISYSAYTYLFHEEIPYPSVGDIGYFGSVLLYIVAIFYLIKALSPKSALSSKINLLWVIAVPLILLVGSYLFFLNGYEFDFSNPLLVFLDFGYPLGQAFYISLAILAFLLSRRYLGGLMKPIVLFLIFALFMQYISDFMFLYRVNRDLWETGGINDYTYLVSYFVMTSALIAAGNVITTMRTENVGDDQITEEAANG